MQRNDQKFLKYFHLNELNHNELLYTIFSHFGEGSEIEEKGWRFQRQGEEYFIEVHLGKQYQIVQIIFSRKFPIEELERLETNIKHNLIDNQVPMIRQVVVFCSTSKIDSFFRYKDLFQICPVPPAAPRPPFAVGEHPFLLEFSYTSSPDAFIDGTRGGEKAFEYVRLLNVLLREEITIPTSISFAWVIEDLGENQLQSAFRQQGYFYDGFSGKLSQFSGTDDLPAMKRTPADEYYSMLCGGILGRMNKRVS